MRQSQMTMPLLAILPPPLMAPPTAGPIAHRFPALLALLARLALLALLALLAPPYPHPRSQPTLPPGLCSSG